MSVRTEWGGRNMTAPSDAPCATVTLSGTLLTVDRSLAELLHGNHHQLVGRRFDTLAASVADAATIAACLRTVAVGASAGQIRVVLTTEDQRDINVHLVVTPRPDESLTIVVIDETARIDAEHDLARLQRRWLSLLRNSTDILFTADSAGTLTSVTSALPERLGWAVEDVVGRTGLGFVHPDDQPQAHQAWLEVFSRQQLQVRLDVRLIHVDHSVTWARLVLTDLRDDPDVLSVVGNLTDITEQKTQEARRLHEESRFRARFDRSRLPQAMQSVDGTYDAVNDAFCALVGRAREELIGQRAAAITHPDDPGAAEAAITELRRGDVEWVQVDRLLINAEGQPVPVRIDATLLRDAHGHPSGCAASLQDLRPLRDSELARADLQNTFDVVAARSRDFITLYDTQGKNVYASPAGLEMFGANYAGSVAELRALMHPDDLEESTQQWAGVLASREARTWRYRVESAHGDWIWVEQTSTNLLDTRAAVVVSTVRDVTAEVAAAEALRVSEALYRAIAETAEEGILVIAPGGIVTYANARLASMMGLELDQVRGKPVWSVLRGSAADTVAHRVRTRRVRGSERYEVPYHHPDGSWRALWVAATPMPDVEGRPEGSLAMISDITEQRRTERELRHAAQHDELTGLPNRAMLMDHPILLDQPGTAVLFIDLDHFKDVNDGRGHSAGDDVLIEVSNRLRSALGPAELVARFGGDEFVVVLHDVDEESALATARLLLDVLSTTYGIEHHSLRIGASIGIAMTPAASADDLMRFADTAMYAAKASGRGRVRLFDRALAEQAEERYIIGAELLAALADDSLEMKYQPVIDIITGEVAGVEALARWDHPTRGTISPTRFVALAELSANSADLDRWVVRRAMRDISELKADWTMPEAMFVGINLSGQSLTDGLDDYIIQCAKEAQLDPSVVTLEITESAIMADKDVAIGVLQRLRDRGFGIAIDDFGTGYSSMAYLRDLPITVLKIDRGFVRGIPDDAHSLAIVTSLIELARSLDLTVVAEGVEKPEHLAALRTRGCALAQGWLWSAAKSPAELRQSGICDQRFDTDGTLA